METSWWLDWSALPERLIWARLQIAPDASAVIMDADGRYHRFANRETACLWLNEDEYSLLAHLIEDGEIELGTAPPSAGSDRELASLMLGLRHEHGRDSA